MFNFEFPNANKVLLAPSSTIHLHLVGCGGTGSKAAYPISTVALLLRRMGQQVQLTFYDPDTVEEENIPRQNFVKAEIGQPKAVALATRLAARGLTVNAVVQKFRRLSFSSREELNILIGCVDDYQGRKDMRDSVNATTWWLDAGNDFNSGQVLIGNTVRQTELAKGFDIPGFVTFLPVPSLVEPGLVLPRAAQLDVSCAEAALRDAQSLFVNDQCAALIGEYLNALLLQRTLCKFGTCFDLPSGTMRSLYNTKTEIAKALNVNGEDFFTVTKEQPNFFTEEVDWESNGDGDVEQEEEDED